MSNILKISTPISGYENNVSKQDPQMKNDVGIKNPVNPDKVVRADSRAEYGNERGVQQGLSYESNFGNFVRTLANIPRASEIMSKMLFSGMRNVIEAGIGTGKVTGSIGAAENTSAASDRSVPVGTGHTAVQCDTVHFFTVSLL